MKTLILEKANVARLRDLLEKETDPLIKEFIRFRLAKARLWHDVAECGVLAPERIEQVKTKARHRVKYVVVGISITVILAIVLFAGSGCNTVREGVYGAGRCIGAVGEDIQWIAEKLGDNVSVQEK